ncbi:MAG TPA: ATP-grasp domain-containing protein [Streptosporangiaceae bacterium]
MNPRPGRRLLVLGSGERVFREYALKTMSQNARLTLISASTPTWELRYCTGWVHADLADAGSVRSAIRDIQADGLLTYDERYVEVAAQVAAERGFPGPRPAAVRAVKDKAELRARLERIAPVRFAVAHSVTEAYAALDLTGLPAVFKPRALGGSAGVRLVTTPDEVPSAFADATTARVGTTRSRYDGALIEEFVDGPEFSIDSVTAGGVTTPVLVAAKQTGLAPYFEETGHIVPEAPGSLPPAALDLVRLAHAAAGLDNVVSHAEVRVSRSGPRLIELNARLGGDLIPYLGMLAGRIDMPAAAAQIALGLPPSIRSESPGAGAGASAAAAGDAAAAVRFVYPDQDLRFTAAVLRRSASEYPGLRLFTALASEGQELRLPPRGYLSRLAAIVVSGGSREECVSRLDAVASDLDLSTSPLVLAPQR